MIYIFAILIGYMLGCSHMSFYIEKIKSVNIKGNGSKNYGASNTALNAGLRYGILVFAHDVSKAVLAMILARLLFHNSICEAIAGCAAVLGHIFPFYLKFNGGKGFAAYIGLVCFLNPTFGFILFAISVVLALLSDYVVAATFSFLIFSMIYFLLTEHIIIAIPIAIISIIIICKHHQNIYNLIKRNGNESKISSLLKKKK
jgi:glycerol-3-phosphate acyltransferase PlsY